MPREEGIDHTFTFLREGYRYILNRSQSFQSNLFETRLLGKKAVCLLGKEAAELFYDEEKFIRQGAPPNRLVETLFGRHAVQTLDGNAHKERKAMFLSLLSKQEIAKLLTILHEQWNKSIDQWSAQENVVLYPEMQALLCRTAFQWAGVPLSEDEEADMAKRLASLFESPAALGPKHWSGRQARNQIEAELEDLIKKVRDGEIQLPEDSIFSQFTFKRNHDGSLLAPEIVAVEVINLLRPIVAIAVYINFIALALQHYPAEKQKLAERGEAYAEWFVQEVRRFYPFFPAVAAIVKQDFKWNGYQFTKGTLALLDLYGTNHDPEHWENPDLFQPERFELRKKNAYDFIPQGGGNYHTGHRCPGEALTIEVMKVNLDYLANQIAYDWPDQDASYSLTDIPSIPNSEIILKNIKRIKPTVH